MKDALQKSAKGQECQMRIPGICNGDPETTVLAHIRRGGVAGVGQKPPDPCGVFACSACHDALDGRTNRLVTMEELDACIVEGQQRTLAWWWNNGYLKA